MSEPASTSLFPGDRLGRPERGPGSVARLGRRLAALAIDYAAATVIATAFFGFDQFALPAEAGLSQFAPMLTFAFIQIVFMPLLGGSPGHRLTGMRVEMLHGGWPGVWRPVVRTVLLVLVIPAVVFDADQRGLHDKAAGTILVRS